MPLLRDGDEIKFGRGVDGSRVTLPDSRLCNLHLAVARVYAASGFAEVVDEIMKDWESGDDIGDLFWYRLVLNGLRC